MIEEEIKHTSNEQEEISKEEFLVKLTNVHTTISESIE